MAVSKKRKKNGKKVGNGTARQSAQVKSRIERFAEQESSLSLQDLINVVAYQEYEKDGTIVDGEVVVEMADDIPVNVINEDGTRRQVGTAVKIEGRDDLSIRVTDHDIIQKLSDPGAKYSIDKEII